MDIQNTVFNELFRQGRQIELARGDVLHDVHDECKALGKIIKGKLRLSRILSSGREITFKEFIPGEIYAELLVFTGEPYPGWLIASENSTVIEVEFSHVLELLGNSVALIEFMSGVSRKTNHLANKIEILSFKTVKQKIAFYLLTENNPVISSVSGLSDNLACSREALSRALSEMAGNGIITRDGKDIRIKDKTELEKLLLGPL